MTSQPYRRICWTPLWNPDRAGLGIEHLLLAEGVADSIVVGFDPVHGPFRLSYRLTWDPRWRLREAELIAVAGLGTRSLIVRTDGAGRWRDAGGRVLDELAGCLDIDIWPTPFTNTFPIRRAPLAIGERREFRMVWIGAPELSIAPQPQAYTRLSARLYRFESLDGSGFTVELPVDAEGIVLDYPTLFCRVP